jgi:hypothetical protein
MNVVSPFNWKEYTDKERAENGDPFKEIKRNAEIGAIVTQTVHKIRKKNPSHGTMFGLTTKNLTLREPEMMTRASNSHKTKGKKC